MTEKSPAETVLDTFGGLTATARAIDAPISTVQGWKERKRVPQDQWAKLLKAARDNGKSLTLEQLAGIEAA